jgi:RHS repeat-associated protein
VLTNYFYHHEDIVKEQVGAEAYEYLHGPGIDEPAIQLCLGSNCAVASSYYYADGLGSIRQLADSAGNILNQYRYGAWGEINEPFIGFEIVYNKYSYTSREFSENNLYFYRARYYNASIGIFLSADPIFYKDKLLFLKIFYSKKFRYSDANPINFVDPNGEYCLPCILILAAGIALLTNYCAHPPFCNIWERECNERCRQCALGGEARERIIEMCQQACQICANRCRDNPQHFICDDMDNVVHLLNWNCYLHYQMPHYND